ncbi:beta-mannanase [Priestia megaterium]|uniref:Beta-mannanase n=1 Tax=Priestia megaterium TaxID=1404 RepID=A0A3D8X3H6_PRIMG|nr:glycosyl hydrolase [Priestia megaterium]MDH3173988.1 glycosyl hydrolase [Priestia megaterium]RDZ14696.1 beta-mannanase [Priestia megaterium]
MKKKLALYLPLTLLLIGIIYVVTNKPNKPPTIQKTNTSQIYEAEKSILNGAKTSKEVSGYSGDGYVTNFHKKDDSAIFIIDAPREGLYKLAIRYRVSSGNGEKHAAVNLNSEPSVQIILKESDKFKELNVGKVLLHKGKNTIKIRSGWGYYDLDYIKLTPDSASNTSTYKNDKASINKEPVNQHATRETKSLMNFLVDQYGKKILSGQQDMSGVQWLNNNIGKKPAVAGFDFTDYSPSKVAYGRQSSQVEEAIKWHQQGGIVTFSWHWNAPKDLIKQPGKEWYKGSYKSATTFDLQYAMDHKDSEDYRLLLRDIDAIAVQLKRLQDAKVPILFRPLHEAEGGWFWWGAKGPEPAKQLYKLMYERLTYYHKINNIIWVWNSVSEDWYPGDRYVDIVSYDSYPKAGNYNAISLQYDRLNSLVNNKKLVSLSENGPIPDPTDLKDYHISWSWFLTWKDEYLRDGIINSREHLLRVYNSPYVITLDELPDLQTYN